MTMSNSSPLAIPNKDIECTLDRRLRQVNLRDTRSVEINIEVDKEALMAGNQMSISNYAWSNLEGQA